MKMKSLILPVLTGILLLSFAFASLSAQEEPPKIPLYEREALIVLYNSTNGDSWKNNSGWKTPPLESDGFAKWGTESSWYGVTLSGGSEVDHVIKLNLSNNNLDGIIPPELGNLIYLQWMEACTNSLKGTLPNTMSSLKSMYWLSLARNKFSGSIPSVLAELTKLELLDLGYNQFSGSIPSVLGNLQNLISLILQDNQLSGSIPKEICNIPNMVELSLAENQLTGTIPKEIGNFNKLVALWLNGNKFTGSIPPELGRLSNLKALNLWDNSLTGTIPPELGKLIKLEYLGLGLNPITGAIPPEIGKLTNLKDLALKFANLSGPIPKELGNLHNLQTLEIEDNEFTGNIPAELGNLTNLVIFHLDANQLFGSIPTELGDLINLTEFCLGSNKLSGNIPSELGNLTELTYLTLDHNRLIGEIPANLRNLTKLAKPNMDISYNCLYTDDPNLMKWLNDVDPDWSEHQDQCPKGQLKVVDQQSGREWDIENVSLMSEVEIDLNGEKIIIPVEEDGTFNITETLPPGYYDVTCRLQYYDYIPYSNNSFIGGDTAPAGGKLKRQSVRRMTRVKINEDNPTFDIKFPLPVFLVHGIISSWKTWNSWVSELLNKGYIVFTPNHDFWGISKIAESSQLAAQFFVDMDYTYSPNHIGLFKNKYPDVYFICHSEGGVVTRVLVNRYPSIRNRIKCIFTLGTPHSGTDFYFASLYELDKCHMVGTFNNIYSDFNGVPVYAISGHEWDIKGDEWNTNTQLKPHDGIVYWNNDNFVNISPFKICTGMDADFNPKIITETFPGYSNSYIANGHHFPFPHTMLIDAGLSRRDILIGTIIPIMGGGGSIASKKEAHQVNFDNLGINSKPFLRKILERTFSLSRQSMKRFKINVSSAELLSVNAMGIKSNITMSLVDPDGKTISKDNYSTYPSASYSADIMSGIGYQISTPKPGKWTIDVKAGDVDDIIAIGASENSNWTVSGYTDKISYQPNTKAVFNAKLYGSTDGVTVSSINADIVKENSTNILSLKLFDDGSHNDKSAGDGIYGNNMTVPDATGNYLVTFHVEAFSDGYSAQSESNWDFYVSSSVPIFKGTFSDESSDSDSDGIKDQIIAKIGLKLSGPGQYILSGNLEDNSDNLVDNDATTIDASNAGNFQGTLTFDLKGLSCSQFKFPFKIKNLIIFNTNDLVPLDEWGTPVSTNTYNGNDFGCNATADATIKLNREKLNFGVIGGTASHPQSITIENSGSGSLNWVISSDSSWLLYDKESGTNIGTVSVSVNSTNLSAGTYEGTLLVTDPLATNSPQSVEVTLKIYNTGENTVPFGEFATPTNGSTVRGSIAVTGWVLDDIGVENVKLYRGEVGKLTYIGDGVFVEGARPDVEQAYPGYPMNYKAGWGYMMLTNFLPGGGNGEFKIHAVVTDAEGNQITLGTKTIRCDNAHAVKPFGAIDTPTQGGTASGKNFVNWGWVLTPLPNKIPEDGSTIKIWVDGKNIGHPTYNIYREDIAALFPGYTNSNGAIGYFYLDTSGYENGIHTIQWTATDNAGNTDGIGSRYFSILNSGESSSNSQSIEKYRYQNDYNSILNFSIEEIPLSNAEPLRIEKGIDEIAHCIEPDEMGIYSIEIEELERLEVVISDSKLVAAGFILVGAQLKPLPVGTTLCQDTGKFHWTPGPGFVGNYHFVFIERDRNNYLSRKELIVDIRPKSTTIHH